MKKRFLTWLGHRLPACEEIARLASARLDRPLGVRQQLQFNLHLRLCAWCRRYTHQLELVHRAAPELADSQQPAPVGPELSAAAKERLQGLLKAGSAGEERA